eukprot:686126-Prorocentrum_minimum.AAC.2
MCIRDSLNPVACEFGPETCEFGPETCEFGVLGSEIVGAGATDKPLRSPLDSTPFPAPDDLRPH